MDQIETIHIKGLKNGVSKSFRWVYDRYHEKVYHYCLRFVQSTAVAEEITSDVFMQLWKKRAQLDTSRPVSGLLFKITKDYAISYLRKVAKNAKLKESFINNFIANRSNSIENGIYLKEYLVIADKAIDALPPKGKAVFKMRYVKNMDNHQIAEALGISPNTVKVHLNRAAHFIKNYLQANSDIVFSILCVYYHYALL